MTGSSNEVRQMLDYSKWDNITLSSDEESDGEEEGTSFVHPDSISQASAMTAAIARLTRSVEARNHRLLDMTNAVCRATAETSMPLAGCTRLREIQQSFMNQPDAFILINFNFVKRCLDVFQQQAILMQNNMLDTIDVLVVFRPSTDQYFFMRHVTKLDQNAMDRWCASWLETKCCICDDNSRDNLELRMENCSKCFAAVCVDCQKAHMDANGIPLPKCPICRNNFLQVVPAPVLAPAEENVELFE